MNTGTLEDGFTLQDYVENESKQHSADIRNAALEEAFAACENERRCYADNHRCHDNFCHDQDMAAILALKSAPAAASVTEQSILDLLDT
jgi:hypothetical protein